MANGISEIQQSALQTLETYIQYVESPLQRLEHGLHPWVAFCIMPIFALANAGVVLGGDIASALAQPISLGIAAGLVLGKQVGITSFAWLAVRCGLADLPKGISWWHIYGASWLAGIGFTMSLFIAGLAFGEGPELTAAKLGILAASLIAGLAGWLILRSLQLSVES
jgi:NhaA family Na+:H+ antiporter